MPIFLPRIPDTDIFFSFPHHAGHSVSTVGVAQSSKTKSSRLKSSLLLNRFDLDVDAGRKIELHERIDRLLGWFEDVDQALVRADLEGLAGLLVDVGRAKNAVLVL